MYAIMGATGHTGAATAESLLARGAAVRVLVRSAERAAGWAAKGAQVRELADAADPAALAAALEGADGAYLMNPPAYGGPDPVAGARAMAESMAVAVERSGLPHVVLLSSVGAQHAEGTGMIRTNHAIEQRLARLATPVTRLRPGYFMENWAHVLQPALAEGVLPSFLQPLDRAVPMNATADIGRIAADALLAGRAAPSLIEIVGPQDRTPLDAAAAVAAAAGRPVQAIAVPREGWLGAFAAAGMPETTASLFAEMYDGINSGHVAYQGTGDLRRGTTTLEAVIAGLLATAR